MYINGKLTILSVTICLVSKTILIDLRLQKRFYRGEGGGDFKTKFKEILIYYLVHRTLFPTPVVVRF